MAGRVATFVSTARSGPPRAPGLSSVSGAVVFVPEAALALDAGERRGELRGDVELLVRYPDSFPFLRPLIFALELRLGNHQNPFAKNLCLLDRDTRQWHPASDSAASHIRDQLDKLLIAVEGTPEKRAAVETPQAEPVSAFIPNTPRAT